MSFMDTPFRNNIKKGGGTKEYILVPLTRLILLNGLKAGDFYI